MLALALWFVSLAAQPLDPACPCTGRNPNPDACDQSNTFVCMPATGAETIAALCPTEWRVERLKGKRNGWSYLCAATGTLIVIGDSNAGLRGSVAGDSAADWIR